MRSKIKLFTLLTRWSIGLCLAIKLASMLMQPTDAYRLDYCLLRKFVLRIIMCSTALIYYLRLQKNKGIHHFIEPYANGYRLTIGTILMQLMMTFALIVLSSIQATLWPSSLQTLLPFSSRIDFLYRGIVEITCLTAILEELLFRGIVEKLLNKITTNRPWITMISALVFSLMHCNVSNILCYFLMGCFSSHLYYQTQHIIYPIIAHGLHNLCAVSIMYLTLDQTLDLAINSLPIVTRIMLAIGVLLAVYRYTTYILIGQKTKNII